MDDKSENMRILEMIESGRISVEEGLDLLAALADTDESVAEEVPALEEHARLDEIPFSTTEYAEPIPPPSPDQPTSAGATDSEYASISPNPEPQPNQGAAGLPPEAEKWRRWWVIPLWIGVGLTILGGLLLYAAVQSVGGVNFWFFCAAVPFTLGLLAIILAWQSRTSPWLHLRVQQAPGETPQRIAISLPLPIRPTAWFLRAFGRKIPGVKDQALDQVILAVGENAGPDNPIYIQVDEGEDGEKVEIYIG
jgi:hypothetical protein